MNPFTQYLTTQVVPHATTAATAPTPWTRAKRELEIYEKAMAGVDAWMLSQEVTDRVNALLPEGEPLKKHPAVKAALRDSLLAKDLVQRRRARTPQKGAVAYEWKWIANAVTHNA